MWPLPRELARPCAVQAAPCCAPAMAAAGRAAQSGRRRRRLLLTLLPQHRPPPIQTRVRRACSFLSEADDGLPAYARLAAAPRTLCGRRRILTAVTAAASLAIGSVTPALAAAPPLALAEPLRDPAPRIDTRSSSSLTAHAGHEAVTESQHGWWLCPFLWPWPYYHQPLTALRRQLRRLGLRHGVATVRRRCSPIRPHTNTLRDLHMALSLCRLCCSPSKVPPLWLLLLPAEASISASCSGPDEPVTFDPAAHTQTIMQGIRICTISSSPQQGR